LLYTKISIAISTYNKEGNMNSKHKPPILLMISVLVLAISACQSADNTNLNSPMENLIKDENFVETAVQILLITDTYAAEKAGQTQTTGSLLYESTLAQTVTAAPSDTAFPTNKPIPSVTQSPTATIPPVTAGFYCVPVNTQRDLAEVVKVIDGDTIEVDLNGTTQRVRYIGIDSPEIGDPYFEKAKNANAAIVGGKTLTLVKDVSETDEYGSLLRYVFVEDDLFVNYELVKDGYAKIQTYPPDVVCSEFFLEAQLIAKNAGLGIWGFSMISTNTSPSIVQPTATSAPAPVCSCSGDNYNCSDFSTHNAAQQCYAYCISQGAGDIHGLDRDNNGSACESLP
jgi:micrococcal nuclease